MDVYTKTYCNYILRMCISALKSISNNICASSPVTDFNVDIRFRNAIRGSSISVGSTLPPIFLLTLSAAACPRSRHRRLLPPQLPLLLLPLLLALAARTQGVRNRRRPNEPNGHLVCFLPAVRRCMLTWKGQHYGICKPTCKPWNIYTAGLHEVIVSTVAYLFSFSWF